MEPEIPETTEAAAPTPVRRCACGETEWIACRGWMVSHSDTSCHIGDSWVPRSVFELPPRALVQRVHEARAATETAGTLLNESREREVELARQLGDAREAGDDWKAAAVSLARLVSLMERRAEVIR